MKIKNIRKKIKSYVKGKSLLFLIIFSFAFLSIGFAASEAIMFDIRGTASANDLHAVYITEVSVREGFFEYNDMQVPYTFNAIPSEASIIYINNYFTHNFSLSDENLNSSVTYKVTVLNNSDHAVRFSGVVYEVLSELGINDNPYIDFTVFGDTDSTVLDISETKVINIRFKYKSSVTDISQVDDNDLKFSISINNIELARVSYINFLGYEGLPKYAAVGENISYTFSGSVPDMIIRQNNVQMVEGVDYTISNNTLTIPVTNTGNISVTRLTQYPIKTEFDLSKAIPNTKFYFKDPVTYNGNETTFYWEVDLDSYDKSILIGNIISIGNDIRYFSAPSSGGYNFHLYYPDANGNLVISLIGAGVTGNMQFLYPVDFTLGTIGKFALNSNGLFFNGELVVSGITLSNLIGIYSSPNNMTPLEAAATFFNYLGQTRNDIKLGSVEGSNRSTFTYNAVREIDQKLTITQMIDLTSIGERTDIRENIPYRSVPLVNATSNNAFSLGFYDLFLHNETFVAEIDPSTMTNTGNENILSLGKEIDKVVPTTEGYANLHFYFNKDTRDLIIQPTFYGAEPIGLKINIPSTNPIIKIAIGRNGLYVNGELVCSMEGLGSRVMPTSVVDPLYLSQYLATFLYGTLENVYSVEVGSKVGSVRSTATINSIKIYSRKMNQPELLFYTAPVINTTVRTDLTYRDINEKIMVGDRFVFSSNTGLTDSITSKTIFVRADFSNVDMPSGNNETFLSLGSRIQTWDTDSGGANIHMYYEKNSKRVIFDILCRGKNLFRFWYNIPDSDVRYFKIAFNENGFYINGELIFNNLGLNTDNTRVVNKSTTVNAAEYFSGLFQIWSTNGFTYKLGSLEGNNTTTTVSTSVYTDVRMYDALMTDEELKYYTKTDLISEMKSGSYVSYVGNNGCVGNLCNGANVDTGYCVVRYHDFLYDGWRIAYSKNGKAHLITAGSPECLGANEAGTLVTSGAIRITHSNANTFMNNLDIRSGLYCNSAYADGGVCDTNNSWAFNEEDYRQILLAKDPNSSMVANSCLGTLTNDCGLNNELINTGSNVVINSISNGDLQMYHYVEDNNGIKLSSIHGSYGEYGIRPVVKLDGEVYVYSGLGTKESPYIIRK